MSGGWERRTHTPRLEARAVPSLRVERERAEAEGYPVAGGIPRGEHYVPVKDRASGTPLPARKSAPRERKPARKNSGLGAYKRDVEGARARQRARADLEAAKQLRDGPRYTAEEIQKLGEEGYALKKIMGRGFHYPIVDSRDLRDAIAALGRAKLQERPTVRKWISLRARMLRLTYLLPKHWPAN